MTELKAMPNKVVFIPYVKEEFSPSGLFLGSKAIRSHGVVVSVGDGVDELKPGDIMMYNEAAAKDKDMEVDGIIYYTVHIDQVFGVVNQ